MMQQTREGGGVTALNRALYLGLWACDLPTCYAAWGRALSGLGHLLLAVGGLKCSILKHVTL